MKISEYISSTFKDFGTSVSKSLMYRITSTYGIDLDADIETIDIKDADICIIDGIVWILAFPSSISESGFSISFDKDGLTKLYKYLLAKYNLSDTANILNTITDITDNW